MTSERKRSNSHNRKLAEILLDLVKHQTETANEFIDDLLTEQNLKALLDLCVEFEDELLDEIKLKVYNACTLSNNRKIRDMSEIYFDKLFKK